MDSLSNILRKDKVLKSVVKATEVKQVLIEKWDDILGKFSTEVHFGYYRDGRLSLKVDNPMWVSELKFYEIHILKQINACLGDVFSRSVRVNTLAFFYEAPKPLSGKLSQKNSIKRSLKDQIIFENERKRRLGMTLCSQCGDVYVLSGICVFCSQGA